MVASTLGVGGHERPDSARSHEGHAHHAGHAGHAGHDHRGSADSHATGVAEASSPARQDEPEELHPWAKEMYRQGLSFNGNERSKLFLGRGDGTFEDLSDLCGADSPLDGRGLLCADFDDDGDLDVFVHNLQRERHNLYRNERGSGGFVKVRLRATASQHEAIGAAVTVDGPSGPTTQVLSRGSGYASCQAAELVFGLGDQADAAVRVLWPGGDLESFGRVGAGQKVLLVEGTGEPEPVGGEPFQLEDPLPQGLKRDLGQVLPAVSLESAEGERVDLEWEELAAGRSVYLNLWASYCRPCVEEVPDLERIHVGRDRTVVSISVDVPDARPAALGVLANAGATYPVYFIGMDEDEETHRGIDELVDLLRLPIPTTLVISPDGRLEDVVRGPVGKAEGTSAGE